MGSTGTNVGDSKVLAKGDVTGSVPPECKMLFCPGGKFPTGLTDYDTRFLGSFFMGETEVTYSLWQAVYTWANSNGYQFQNAGTGSSNKPVASVNWRDAVVWCNALSQMSGLTPVYVSPSGAILKSSMDADAANVDPARNSGANGFRLPSQWEWECAARWRGTNNAADGIHIGALYWTPGGYCSGAANTSGTAADLVAFQGSSVTSVKSLLPNALGCYDMSGNVMEWCFGTAAADSYIRNLRGGCWYQTNAYMGVGTGLGFFPYSKGNGVGFRLALSQSSNGTDGAFSSVPIPDPVPGPPRSLRTSPVSTKIRWQDQKDACLETPSALPINRADISCIQLSAVGESDYTSKDPTLAPDMAKKNQMLYNMFQSGVQAFETCATGNGDVGMTPAYVDARIQDLKNDEAAGLSVYGFWMFREDAFLFGHYLPNGSYDPAFYGEYMPPFPDVDPRIPSLKEVQNFRNQIQASNLNCKTNYKMILLLLQNTMLRLQEPLLPVGSKTGIDAAAPQDGKPWHAPISAARANEVLTYIKTNFDGYGEEVHIGFHEAPPTSWDGFAPLSQATYARWCKDNGKIGFMFLGGGAIAFENGLGYAKQSYELLFQKLQANGIQPNAPDLVYFRQGGFQAIQQVPEDLNNNLSPTTFSEVGWLNKRLSGPVVTSKPNLNAVAGQTWTYQPTAVTFSGTAPTWSLTRAPAGMTINPSTGLLQWTPPTWSSATTSGPVTLVVSEGVESDTQNFEVAVPIQFNLSAATLTGSSAVVTLNNQVIGGVACQVTLTITGYSSPGNPDAIAFGTGVTAGGLVVGTNNDIAINNGLNFDVQVTGAPGPVSYDISSFTIAGAVNTVRDYSITNLAGNTLGAQGDNLATELNFSGSNGVPVNVSMQAQTLKPGIDFAWNRIGSGGAIMSLSSLSMVLTTAGTTPVISAIPGQAVVASTNTGPVGFTIGSSQTIPSALTLSGTSSNTALVPSTGIAFSGSGASRFVTVTPAANQLGTATIMVTVSDASLNTATSSFLLTVTGTPQEAWRFANFGTTANAGSAADLANADGDEWTNEQEYLLGGNPRVPDSAQVLTASNSGSSIVLSFAARQATGPGYTGLSRYYDLETATSPAGTASWTPVTGYTNILGLGQTVTATQSLSAGPHFFRLKVHLE